MPFAELSTQAEEDKSKLSCHFSSQHPLRSNIYSLSALDQPRGVKYKTRGPKLV